MPITADRAPIRASGPATGSYGSRLAWDKNGLLYVTLGDRNYRQDGAGPGSHIGKILRLRDDGSVPPDNPFVGKPGCKPEIYTLGHRNPLGLAFIRSPASSGPPRKVRRAATS